MVNWPVEKVETGIDYLINSNADPALKAAKKRITDVLAQERETISAVNRQLQQSQSQPLGTFDDEAFLWKWWLDSLRKLESEKHAEKIYNRFNPTIQAWKKELNPEARVACLINALAFTSMVYDAQT